MQRFRRNGRDVDAILFDGSAAAAGEICTRFSGVANHEACVAVTTPFGQVFAGAGCWIVRDCRTRSLSVVDDREFTALFEVVDEPAFDSPAFVAGRERSHRWDVVR